MKWALERWVKLYVQSDPKWLRLDLSTRSFASELLKIADLATGVIAIGDEDPTDALARLTFAKGHEMKRLRADVAALLKDGFIERHPDGLAIPNFPEAQRRHSSSAARMRRLRERNGSGDGDESDGAS